MNKINYDEKMDAQLKEIKEKNERPKLLMHTCCAPCCCAAIETLSSYFDITLYYYNPNITDKDEYEKRYSELERYITNRYNKSIPIIKGKYDPKECFFDQVKGMEQDKEGGRRCFTCYRLRMEDTCIKAKEMGSDYFTTVLSISPQKNSQKINEIGEELAKKYKIKFLYGDLKKKGRYLRGIEISKEYGLYRQDHCGCVFSKKPSDIFI